MRRLAGAWRGARHNGAVKLFPERLDAATRQRLADHVGGRPRVLAWGRAETGAVVALPDRLCVPGTNGGWDDVPWHDVLHGGWDDEGKALRWTRLSTSEQQAVVLGEPGSLPEVFRERVKATFLFSQVVHPRPGKAITITARRNLADGDARILWTAHPARGVRMDAETLAFAEQELARLRAEYAF